MASPSRMVIFAAGIASVVGAALVPFLTPYPPPPAWIWSLNIAAGLSLVAVGFLLSLKRPDNGIGLLVGLAGIFYFAFTLSWFSSPFLWTLSTLTVGIGLAIAAHFIVAFPEGRLRSRFDRTLVVFIYSWAAATNFSLLALLKLGSRRASGSDAPISSSPRQQVAASRQRGFARVLARTRRPSGQDRGGLRKGWIHRPPARLPRRPRRRPQLRDAKPATVIGGHKPDH